ncbi:MAG TPA: DNA (cytosine-5-)-methyltransferase, partial [Pyrinomonadaceae bacterium]|nr:DNA (cytosine-5-)-methyltransferase [Pyrinomonadaceae bacterium]
MNDQHLAKPQGRSSRALGQCKSVNKDYVTTNPIKRKLVAEFFSGIGLMRVSLEKEGWSVAFANDIDDQKVKMYNDHFRDDGFHVVPEDIHDLSAESIPTVDLATASFPCNDLSLAGSRNGLSGEHSSAFWGFIKIIRELRERQPAMILIENVPGFLTSHDGKDFRNAMLALNKLGYLVDAFMLDASYFVPQSRQRLFVVGCLERHAKPTVIFSENVLRPRALSNFIVGHSDIRWHIKNLPTPITVRKHLTSILERLPPYAPEWWSQERTQYLLNQMSPRHRAIADGMMNGKRWSYGTVFRRVRNSKSMAELRVDGLAGCLRTPRGGSGRQILFKAGKGKCYARLLTPRECARLMGVDDYVIRARSNQALFGFGDAVCVPVIRWIASHYLNPMFD